MTSPQRYSATPATRLAKLGMIWDENPNESASPAAPKAPCQLYLTAPDI
ncbi:hypothetical protein ACIBHX_45695 [Nonomuraea sp. NPDC050536]